MDDARVASAAGCGRWLVTGAGGQVGRSALALARRHAIEAHGLDSSALDIADADSVAAALEAVRPDVVLNCAAFTQVDLCEERESEAERANALGPEVLAAACRDRALLVHLSTDYVFDGAAHRPIPEDAAADPQSAYGRTKWRGEQRVRAAGGEHLIVRSQWIFGPGSNFVRSISAAILARRPLRVVEDQVGRPTWSGALAAGLFSAVGAGARGTLHLACEGVCSWYDLAVEVVREGASRGHWPRVEVTPIATRELPRPAPRPTYGVLDLERARALGVVAPHWREALGSYLDAESEGRDA